MLTHREDTSLSPKDRICRQIIEYGIIGLLIFSPLPAASVDEWAILVIQLTVLVMTGVYFFLSEKPAINEALSHSAKWLRFFITGFAVFIFIQVIPLPVFLVKILSPTIVSFREEFASVTGQTKFITLSLVPSQTFRAGLEIITYFLLGFLIFKTVTGKKQVKRIFAVLIGMGIFQALYGLFELCNPNPRILFYKKLHNLESVTGTFVNRNHLAGYLEMIIPLAIAFVISRLDLFSFKGTQFKEKILLLSRKGFSKNFIVLTATVLMGIAVILSHSRSGIFLLFLTFVLFLEFIFLFFRRTGLHSGSASRYINITFLIITFLILYVGIGHMIDRFSTTDLGEENRLNYWKNTYDIISQYPVFGTGWGTFSAVYPAYEKIPVGGRVSHAHNDYLETFAEVGILGGLLIFGLIFIILFQTFKMWKERRHPEIKGLGMGGLVAIFVILLHSLTDFNLQIPANMLLFTVVLTLTWVIVYYRREEH
ncbi:MAG: O-antigen ligase family protein [Candidatus Aminicenantes bacterium]|nr:O-antigen ligase family protein [Candidatus Aminicenantes bacterium]